MIYGYQVPAFEQPAPIVGLFSESRSAHLNATKRAFFRAFGVGLITWLGLPLLQNGGWQSSS